METIDIVNDKDEVIGQRDRRECHEKGIAHRCSGIVLFRDDSRKEVVVQKRSKLKEQNPGKIDFVAGHLGVGETYLECARRELKEEMFKSKKIEINLEELFKIKIEDGKDIEFTTYYSGIYDGDFDIDEVEVEDVYYIDVKELKEDVAEHPERFTPALKLVLERLGD